MASSKEYLEFILDQLGETEHISHRKMMGEYIIYYKDKVWGGIYDDRFLVKITDSSRRLMPESSEEIPYEGAKLMLMVDNVENKQFLRELAEAMYDELPAKIVKKKKSKNKYIIS